MTNVLENGVPLLKGVWKFILSSKGVGKLLCWVGKDDPKRYRSQEYFWLKILLLSLRGMLLQGYFEK